MDKKKLLRKEITYNYDKKMDVLYISFGKPQKAICVEKEEDLLVRVDPFTNQSIIV